MQEAQDTFHMSHFTRCSVPNDKWPCNESSNPCVYDVASKGETSDCFRRDTSHIASAVAPFPMTWR